MALELDEKQQKTVNRLREMCGQWPTIRIVMLVFGVLFLVITYFFNFESEFFGLFLGVLLISFVIQNWHGRPGFLLLDVIDELDETGAE